MSIGNILGGAMAYSITASVLKDGRRKYKKKKCKTHRRKKKR